MTALGGKRKFQSSNEHLMSFGWSQGSHAKNVQVDTELGFSTVLTLNELGTLMVKWMFKGKFLLFC